jgi:hypothetical protein
MNNELMHELQLLQQSRANKFADELTDRFLSSVEAVNEKFTSSISKRGNMLMILESRLSLSTLKKLRERFFKK